MEQPFSSMLKTARVKLALTQKALCDQIKNGLRQSTYSAWECGRQVPLETDKLLDPLAHSLKLDPEAMRNALKSQSGGRSDPMTKAYSESQAYIAKVGPQNLSLWTLGTARLHIADPGESGDSSRLRWKENLKQGGEFRFIWLLDMVEPADLRRLVAALYSVCRLIIDEMPVGSSWRHGKFVHYGVVLAPEPTDNSFSPNDLRRSVNADTYQQLMDEVEKNGWSSMIECKPVKMLSYKLWRDLQACWVGFGSVILYSPKSLGNVPKASVVLRDVLHSIDATLLEPCLVWLPSEQANSLHEVIRRFESTVQEPTIEQVPRTAKSTARQQSGPRRAASEIS